MPDQPTDFERSFAARLRGHLDAAVGDVDAGAVVASVAAEAERVRPVVPARVRWMATPPTRWRPVAVVAVMLTLVVGGALVGGALDEPSPSPRPSSTAVVVRPSADPSPARASGQPSPEPTEAPGLRRLASNGLLAWAEDGEIHLIAADGSGHRVLDHGGDSAVEPAWSPDGAWIAYWVDGAQSSVWKIRPDGAQREMLTGPELDVRGGPVWSPDGSWMAFLTQRDAGLTVTALHVATNRTVDVALGQDPDWAPDSRRLVLVQGPPDEPHLAVADLEGNVSALTRGFSDASPDWSPVDALIVFDRLASEPPREQVMAIAPDGSGLIEVTDPAAGVRDAGSGFDPFGRRIAFNRDGPASGYEPSLIDTGGVTVRRAGDLASPWLGPIWSPDGRFLIADSACCNRGGISRLAIVDAESGVVAYEFEPSRTASRPSWQPLRYAVDCGPLDEVECRDQAIATVAAGLSQHPGKRVLSIRFETECGTYTLDFTDGTGVGADIDCVRP
jgi:Tol biopolymer transport system component